MSAPIQLYVDVNATLTPSGAPQAGFGTPAFINANAIGSTILQGPYASLAEVVSGGHAAGTAFHDFSVALLQQNPRPDFWYSIKDVGTGPAIALAAAVAEDPGAFYGIAMESRDSADILATAAIVETLSKIAIFQSNDASLLAGVGPTYNALFGGTPTDGTYILTFTGFGLGAPVLVTTTRAAGTPATNDDLAADFQTQLTTALGGTLATVLAPGSIGGTGANAEFRLLDGLATGTIVASGTAVAGAGDLTVTALDGDIGSALFSLQYTRTALVYHATDSEMLAERWLAMCLGFDLDTQQISWSYKQLVGIAGSNLTAAQITELRDVNVNYFSTAISSAGELTVAFTSQGVMPSGAAGLGRLINVTTSLDWLVARKEEAGIGVFLSEPAAVFLDDPGINRFKTASSGVNTKGLNADHLIKKQVPAGQDYAGRETPLIDAPLESEIETADREAGILRLTEVVYLKPTAQKVVIDVQVRR